MLKRTPLYEEHRKLGAKLVDFGGWEMPIQYKSIIAEYQAVRSGVGVFDVSHMGEVEISGEGALELVQHLVSNDVAALKVNQVLYSPLCYPNGMTVDDLLVYRRPEQYLLVVNADNTPKDLAWIKGQAERFPQAQVRDASLDYGQLAIQGPEAAQALQPFIEYDLARISYYWAVEIELQGQAALVSRTGYTGEDGFEVYASPRATVRLWQDLLAAGVAPVALGARDALRLEAAYALYGNELDEQTTPIEAGLGWTVKDKKGDYNGKEVLLRQKREGGRKALIGFRMIQAGVPRYGYPIFVAGREVGQVTSGMKSPKLDAYLGLGYLPWEASRQVGERVQIEVRGQHKQAELVKLPFYRGSVHQH
ncbi:MAG TPA: glycine cleavage system aminomethyltransferase GcvT [Candidatus Fraserbacteria bacterium]|nr:glycine cleavage system aminomethyltransferase GcvT [Candidatus Fraserbacteria bacterium]